MKIYNSTWGCRISTRAGNSSCFLPPQPSENTRNSLGNNMKGFGYRLSINLAKLSDKSLIKTFTKADYAFCGMPRTTDESKIINKNI